MTTPDIHGTCPPAFAAVKDAFAANFAAGEEIGARFTLCEDGEVVLDIWAGAADRAREKPFDDRTVTQVFSTTKAVAALLVARLVDDGRLAYDQPVAEVWPEFAQAGKDAITVEQAMSHQAGLSGFREEMKPDDWFDWDGVCARLAAMAPLWPPGTASGYHPVTYGFLAGEIFRRVDGRTMALAFDEDFARPFGLDFAIGMRPEDRPRAADLQRPTAFPQFGEINEATEVAFLKPWSSPAGGGAGVARSAPIPSTNGYGTAEALARLMAVFACDGELAGRQVLTPETVAACVRERIRGPDLVLPYEMSWAAGLMRNAPLSAWGPGEATVGHSGWGGSCAFADPERRWSGAYVMNKQGIALVGDARPRRLIEAAYAAAG